MHINKKEGQGIHSEYENTSDMYILQLIVVPGAYSTVLILLLFLLQEFTDYTINSWHIWSRDISYC